MKAGSLALNNFLLSVQGLSPTNQPIAPVASFWYADLFTITRLDGVVCTWTSWGLPITTGILQATRLTIESAVWGSGNAVFYVESTASLTTGQTVSVCNATPTGWNFDNVSIFVADAVSFSVPMTTNPGAYLNSGVVAIVSSPSTFTSFGPYLRRTSVSWSTGLDNKSMKIMLGADSTMQLGPSGRVVPVLQALAQDLFTSASVRVDRLIMATPGSTSLGTYNLWQGIVGDVSVKRASAEITVDSQLILLNVQTPRTLYSPGCRHVFGDSSCTIDLSTVTDPGTVTGGNRFVIATDLTPAVAPVTPVSAPSTTFWHNTLINLPARNPLYVVVTYVWANGETLASPEAITAGVPPSDLLVVFAPPSVTGATGYNVYMGGASGDEQLQNPTPLSFSATSAGSSSPSFTEPSTGFVQGAFPPIAGYGGYYAEGVMSFISGVNTGLARQVQSSDGSGNITLSSGFPQAPASGDTFLIRRGCDKTITRCGTFLNLVNFGGMPFVPQPEASA